MFNRVEHEKSVITLGPSSLASCPCVCVCVCVCVCPRVRTHMCVWGLCLYLLVPLIGLYFVIVEFSWSHNVRGPKVVTLTHLSDCPGLETLTG